MAGGDVRGIRGHRLWAVAPGITFELVESPEWMSEAACLDADPGVFFAEQRAGYDQARAICSRCPVIGECRRWNDEVEMLGIGARGGVSALAGVFAGESPKERVVRRRRGGHDVVS